MVQELDGWAVDLPEAERTWSVIEAAPTFLRPAEPEGGDGSPRTHRFPYSVKT
jgi:hypothetical protein